jgi:hypothetical protein
MNRIGLLSSEISYENHQICGTFGDLALYLEAPMGFGLLSMKLYLIVRFLLERQQKIEYFEKLNYQSCLSCYCG